MLNGSDCMPVGEYRMIDDLQADQDSTPDGRVRPGGVGGVVLDGFTYGNRVRVEPYSNPTRIRSWGVRLEPSSDSSGIRPPGAPQETPGDRRRPPGDPQESPGEPQQTPRRPKQNEIATKMTRKRSSQVTNDKGTLHERPHKAPPQRRRRVEKVISG